MGEWTNFIITAAGASAALAGFVIVAISVNISRILSYPHLPARAGATIGTLMLILVTSMVALIPQGLRAFGIEVVGFGVCCWLLQLRAAQQMLLVPGRPWYEAAQGITLGQLQTLPFIAGGAMLWASHDDGMYWLAAATVASFIFSMLNAWVLLVEILR
jgi:modulator of FtsH protease